MSWTCKVKDNTSPITPQNQVKLLREEVDGHLQLLMLKSVFLGCILGLTPLQL